MEARESLIEKYYAGFASTQAAFRAVVPKVTDRSRLARRARQAALPDDPQYDDALDVVDEIKARIQRRP